MPTKKKSSAMPKEEQYKIVLKPKSGEKTFEDPNTGKTREHMDVVLLMAIGEDSASDLAAEYAQRVADQEGTEPYEVVSVEKA